jgi:acyl carrier protein
MIAERVQKIVSDYLGCSVMDVKLESDLREDLGADSLDLIELTMAMEEEFDIEIPDADAEKMKTMGDVVSYIEEKKNAKT